MEGSRLFLMIDMDDFKDTNDSLGHEVGNEVIKGVTRVIESKIRVNEDGFAARYGGDEFVVVLPGDISSDNLSQRAEEIRKTVDEAKLRAGKRNVHQTVSIGIGSWNEKETATQFLERVDAAMYKAKKQGRNRVVEAK